MRLLHLCVLPLLLALGWGPPAGAQWRSEEATVAHVYVFWRTGCPHCERALAFLDRLALREPRLRVHTFNVWEGKQPRELLIRLNRAHRIDISAVPLTVIGTQAFSGYLDDASTGAAIEAAVYGCLAHGCPDLVAPLLVAPLAAPPPEPASVMPQSALPSRLALPLLGEVATEHLSLPMLTLVLAALDGFNPCAMWTLIMLLGILVGLPDRRRRWLLGGAFIAASALVYFLFMAAWLNLFLFLGLITWVRAAIGILALAGGGYYLRQYVLNRDAVCIATAGPRRKRVFDRMIELAGRRNLILALGGIVLLAFAVNLVELLCSAGIPAVYTQVLTLSALPAWQYYGYLLGYIVVFMLDDLVVFFAAMKALEVSGLDTRYARYSHLIGGLVLVALGALLLLRQEWLSFG